MCTATDSSIDRENCVKYSTLRANVEILGASPTQLGKESAGFDVTFHPHRRTPDRLW
jgi:hypothetical protein